MTTNTTAQIATSMTDTELGQAITLAIKATGNKARFWQENKVTRVYVGVGSGRGYFVISNGAFEARLTGYGQSDVILAAARSVLTA